MMRAVLGLVTLLLLAGPLAAEEAGPGRAPSEKAALSATRNFLRALKQVPEEDQSDLLARYVDAASLTSRIFGGALDGLSRTQRAKIADALQRLLSKSLLAGVRDLPDIGRVGFESAELPGAMRSVSFARKSRKLALVWAPGTNGRKSPRVVDLGSSKLGFMSVFIAERWKKSGQAPGVFIGSLVAKSTPRARQLKISKDNIMSLITYMLFRQIGRVGGRWPAYSGKAFVLSVVATGDLGLNRVENLEILFSPADKVLSLASVGIKRYKDVTKKALKEGTFDVSDLTSYAGRRNAEPGMMITPDLLKEGTPLIADLSFDDVAIVGFSGGDVRVFTRKQLGLGPEDPIVVGDKAKSEILRVLSDK